MASDGWIDTHERLPSHGTCADWWSITANGRIRGGKLLIFADEPPHVVSSDGRFLLAVLSHWRPLPPPPDVDAWEAARGREPSPTGVYRQPIAPDATTQTVVFGVRPLPEGVPNPGGGRVVQVLVRTVGGMAWINAAAGDVTAYGHDPDVA